MATKDTVRYLAGSVSGLADRLRQGRMDSESAKRQEEMLGLQKRQMGLSEASLGIKSRQSERSTLLQSVFSIADTKAEEISRTSKGKIPKEQAMYQALGETYSKLPPEQQALLPEFRNLYGGVQQKTEAAPPPASASGAPPAMPGFSLLNRFISGIEPQGQDMGQGRSNLIPGAVPDYSGKQFIPPSQLRDRLRW